MQVRYHPRVTDCSCSTRVNSEGPVVDRLMGQRAERQAERRDIRHISSSEEAPARSPSHTNVSSSATGRTRRCSFAYPTEATLFYTAPRCRPTVDGQSRQRRRDPASSNRLSPSCLGPQSRSPTRHFPVPVSALVPSRYGGCRSALDVTFLARLLCPQHDKPRRWGAQQLFQPSGAQGSEGGEAAVQRSQWRLGWGARLWRRAMVEL